MQGWRPQAQNTQKAWVAINVKSDLTLVGFDEKAMLNGVSLGFNTVNNVISTNESHSCVRVSAQLTLRQSVTSS